MTKLFFIDYEPGDFEIFESLELPILKGSIGLVYPSEYLQNRANRRSRDHEFYPIIDIPKNIHEYDIIVLDLFNKQFVQNYGKGYHKNTILNRRVNVDTFSLYNSRPLGGELLGKYWDRYDSKKRIIIVFADETESSNDKLGGSCNLYSFDYGGLLTSTSHGTEIEVINNVKYPGISDVLRKYEDSFNYKVSFKSLNKSYDIEKDALLKNYNGEIVSYVNDSRDNIFIYLPWSSNKDKLVYDLLTEAVPEDFPEVIPEIAKHQWATKEEYLLPEEIQLIDDKKAILKSYQEELNKVERKIYSTRQKHGFLYEMLKSTDSNLVNAIIKYFEWLEFENVVNFDEDLEDGEKLREDIRINLDDGVLVIECKGIGGTSTDNDCSQVYKFITRLQKERKSFDVKGLYVVNHQRHIEPKKRDNPPFTDDQIRDAEHDERGLLTTWQLFNAYKWVKDGLITKEQVRENILKYGLIDLIPD